MCMNSGPSKFQLKKIYNVCYTKCKPDHSYSCGITCKPNYLQTHDNNKGVFH